MEDAQSRADVEQPKRVVGVPFVPGDPRRHNGRPKGSRNKLGEDFIRAVSEDFAEHGKDAIERVRAERPQDYLKVVASILPKQTEITLNDTDSLDTEQLKSALSSAIRDLAALGVGLGFEIGASANQADQREPNQPVPALQ